MDRLAEARSSRATSLEGIRSALQRKVGIAAGLLGLGIAVVSGAHLMIEQGRSLAAVLMTPQFIALALSSAVFGWTAVSTRRLGRIVQVAIIVVNACLAALDADPGDVTSAVFVVIAYGAAWQYGLLESNPMVKTIGAGVAYIACLALGLYRNSGGTPLAAVHTTIGVVTFGYIGLAIIRARLQTGIVREAELERTVSQRTADLEHRLIEIEKLKSDLEVSLQEKETLLRELHHRTKNNLQLVLSFIDIERNTAPAQEVLDVTEGRIRSLAAVHEHLLLDRSSSEVDLDALISTTALALWSVAGEKLGQVAIEAETDVSLHVDRAIPLGLVANELITNALKHADTGGSPTVVQLHSTEVAIKLTVRTPYGPAKEAPDFTGTGEGNRIVTGLVRQLHGTVTSTHSEDQITVVVEIPFTSKELEARRSLTQTN